MFKKSSKKKEKESDVSVAARTSAEEDRASEDHPGQEQGEEVPPEAAQQVYEPGQVSQFLKLIRQAVALKDIDSLRMSLAASMHEGDSALERFVTMKYPDLLMNAADAPTRLERLLALTKWQLAFFQVFLQFKKKPFNPLQGEIFLCEWELTQGKLQYQSEQVTHHPPSSAFVCKSHEKGIAYFGHDCMKNSFTGTAMKIVSKGFRRLHLQKWNETYDLKLPTVYIRGLLVGRPYFVMSGECTIVCKETGLQTRLHFKDKPWIGGQYHQISGSVQDASHQELAQFTGTWTKKVEIVHKNKEAEVFFDPASLTPTEATVPPIDVQNPMESQRLWGKVSKALKTGEGRTAEKEKELLENLQRKQGNETFQPELFEVDPESGFFHPKPFQDIEVIRKELTGWLPQALKSMQTGST